MTAPAPVGDKPAADDAFRQALCGHERLRAPAFIAVTKAGHSRAVTAADPHRSRTLLQEARDLATEPGLHSLVRAT